MAGSCGHVNPAMNILSLILMLLLFGSANGQQMVAGTYQDYFGEELELNADYTFKHRWRFDLASTWAKGEWTIKNDTIYLKAIPVYDSLFYKDEESDVKLNKLVVSIDETSEKITYEQHAMNSLVSGGQNIERAPKKLFYRNGKLFNIDEKGRLIKKKQKGLWSGKKYPPYFIRNK